MLERIDKFDTDPQSLARKAKIWTGIKWIAGIGFAIAMINHQWPHILDWATYEQWLGGFFASLKQNWPFVFCILVVATLCRIASLLEKATQRLEAIELYQEEIIRQINDLTPDEDRPFPL